MDRIARGSCRVLRAEELAEPIRPIDALAFHADDPYVALLDSAGPSSKLGRYSFLCVDPFLIFRSKGKRCFAGPPGAIEPLAGDPLDELESLLERHGGKKQEWRAGLPPFVGGAVGYFAYEMLYRIEDVPNEGLDDRPVPDSYFLFCDTVLAYDAETGRSWAFAQGFGDDDAEAELRAESRLFGFVHRLKALPRGRTTPESEPIRAAGQRRPRLTEKLVLEEGIKPVIDRAGYLDVVRAAKEHIFAGDVFEICTTNRFDTEYHGSALELYQVLRAVNEAPFSSFLRFPEVEIISSSPERYMRLDREGWAETRPIKGTRPRGKNPAEDRAWYESLATSEKDRAENVMIVDLARNDLGRVCEFGSVHVPELRVVETYPTTFQLVSTVRGRLRPEYGPVDLIRASFPGGSMTGAPKVESMKIIDRLEPVKRGIYSGSIGYIDFDGSFDLNIVIRTFVKKGQHLSFHVGGAVVADSSPEDEYQETLDKASGLVTALAIARAARRDCTHPRRAEPVTDEVQA